MESTSNTCVGLKCRSCRAVIFDSENIFTEHTTDKRSIIKSKSKLSSPTCSHYFMEGDLILGDESLRWLEKQIQNGNQEGQITCFKCCQKLGSFNWKGQQCACGAWQIPAIGIIKSKVDPILKRTE